MQELPNPTRLNTQIQHILEEEHCLHGLHPMTGQKATCLNARKKNRLAKRVRTCAPSLRHVTKERPFAKWPLSVVHVVVIRAKSAFYFSLSLCLFRTKTLERRPPAPPSYAPIGSNQTSSGPPPRETPLSHSSSPRLVFIATSTFETREDETAALKIPSNLIQDLISESILKHERREHAHSRARTKLEVKSTPYLLTYPKL